MLFPQNLSARITDHVKYLVNASAPDSAKLYNPAQAVEWAVRRQAFETQNSLPATRWVDIPMVTKMRVRSPEDAAKDFSRRVTPEDAAIMARQLKRVPGSVGATMLASLNI